MNTIQRVVDLAERHSVQERLIGAILIDGANQGRRRRVALRLQRERASASGDAAKQLGLITDADIEQAPCRASSTTTPYLSRGESKVAEEVVAAH